MNTLTSDRRAIVGLGNPGERYRKTRHNLGFVTIDTIADARNVKFTRECKCYLGKLIDGDMTVLLAKPATYMNNSGRAARALLERYSLQQEDLIFVCDDFNLPLGEIRIRRKGSCGGHKGLESVATELGHCEFPRLRIGVGSPGRRDPIEYVLDDFKKSELPVIEEAVRTGVDTLTVWLSESIDEAMNRFN